MKKPSKRTRARAAEILSAVAFGCAWTWDEMTESVGGDEDSKSLALDAVISVEEDDYEPGDWPTMWAEAEARLRNGEYP